MRASVYSLDRLREALIGMASTDERHEQNSEG
jgi:hypothetical protein